MLTLINLDENAKMTDCYFEKKDWRACTAEVSFLNILLFHLLLSIPILSIGVYIVMDSTDIIVDGGIQTVLEISQQR